MGVCCLFTASIQKYVSVWKIQYTVSLRALSQYKTRKVLLNKHICPDVTDFQVQYTFPVSALSRSFTGSQIHEDLRTLWENTLIYFLGEAVAHALCTAVQFVTSYNTKTTTGSLCCLTHEIINTRFVEGRRLEVTATWWKQFKITWRVWAIESPRNYQLFWELPGARRWLIFKHFSSFTVIQLQQLVRPIKKVKMKVYSPYFIPQNVNNNMVKTGLMWGYARISSSPESR